MLELSGKFDRTTALNMDIKNGTMTATVAQQPAKIGKIVKKTIDSPISGDREERRQVQVVNPCG